MWCDCRFWIMTLRKHLNELIANGGTKPQGGSTKRNASAWSKQVTFVLAFLWMLNCEILCSKLCNIFKENPKSLFSIEHMKCIKLFSSWKVWCELTLHLLISKWCMLCCNQLFYYVIYNKCFFGKYDY